MGSKVATRDGWTRVRFGDIVRLSTERCADPPAAGIDRYVGLEHINPGDLLIRSWGNVADGVTFTNRFRPGQVLFGKRRAYQRKVAVAEFDGICSSDIYVFEPADDRLLPELLPFICQTDGFFEHALKTSAGSLSPRTNWTSLADYQLDIPRRDAQSSIARALTAATDVVDSWRRSTTCALTTRQALAEHIFASLTNHFPELPIGEFVTSSGYGPRFPTSQYSTAGNAWSIRTTDFTTNGGIDLSTVPGALLDEAVVLQHRLVDEDFLLSRSGEYAGLVRVFRQPREDERAFVAAAFLIRFRLDRQRLLPSFLREYCESPTGMSRLRTITQGSAQPNISGSAFMGLRIAVPDIGTQQRLYDELAVARSAEHTCAVRLDECAGLVNELSRTLLMGSRQR